MTFLDDEAGTDAQPEAAPAADDEGEGTDNGDE